LSGLSETRKGENPKMPGTALPQRFCFFPWRRQAAEPCVLRVRAGAEPRRLQLSHSPPQDTHVCSSSVYHFQPFLPPSEGGKDSHKHVIHNYTLQNQRSALSIEVISQNKENGKKSTPSITDFKLMQRNKIADKN